MSDQMLSYPCQEVVGEGSLCGMPCDPGFVRCKEHRKYSDKRALAHMMEMAQDRILRKVDEALDGAVDMLIRLSTEAQNENARIQAIDKLLTLSGFANLKIDGQLATNIDPMERDKILIGLIKKAAEDEKKYAELEAKNKVVSGETDIIDAEVIDDTDS